MNDESIKLIIKAQDEASKQIKDVQDQIHGMSGAVAKAGPSFLMMASAVAVGQAAFAGLKWAVGEVVSVFKDVITKAGESADILKQTEAVIASTKGVAGMTAESIGNLATKLSSVIPVDDELIQSTENMLLTFTNIGKNIFPQVTETALDMSIALGQDTKSSAIQLGKALQDPIAGVTALRRVGVAFTESQKDQIKVLVESGKSLEAQNLILKELQTEFGGSARAAGTTFAGQMKILGTQVDNVKESIGTAIIEAITPFIQKLTAWAATDEAQQKIKQISEFVAKMTADMIKWVVEVAIPWVTQHWPAIKKAVQEAWDIIKGITNFITGDFGKALGAAILTIIAVTEAIKGWIAVQTIIDILLTANPIGIVIVAIGALVAGIVVLVTHWKQVCEWTEKAWNWLKKFLGLSSENNMTPEEIKKISNDINLSTGMGIIPGRASGGPVSAGRPYIVGENGPEFFMPSTSGNIVPNNQNSQNITINFNGDINNTDNKSIDEIGRRLARQLELVRLGVSV